MLKKLNPNIRTRRKTRAHGENAPTGSQRLTFLDNRYAQNHAIRGAPRSGSKTGFMEGETGRAKTSENTERMKITETVKADDICS